MSDQLNPLTLPLWGSRLIEASAGTGKTWTIAALYLRLVLGHGGEHGFARPLLPSEILVMTFTRAATRELSDRIRARLLQAAQAFRADDEPQDPLLAGLRAAYPAGPARSLAAWRLDTAAQSMDDAAVHTIDAWCQRMLREHAFDSGCLFDEELSANERALHDEAALDYWRQQIYPLTGATLDEALAVWPQAQRLAADTHELCRHSLPADSAHAAHRTLADVIDHARAHRRQAISELKPGWAARAAEMQAWLDTQWARKDCIFDKRKLAQRHYTGWLQGLAAWAADPDAETLDLGKGHTRLTPAGLQDAAKSADAVVAPVPFAAFAQLQQDLADVPRVAPALRVHAATRVAQRLAELKAQSGSFGFADMLARLDAALDPQAQGPSAGRLRQRIVAQYPVALVDEFQDTSPVQARIFDRLYDVAAHSTATALLLIGDPKQAIYGFRGADIYSYLATRAATVGRHHRLGTNHRSTAAVVGAVNHLFAGAEARAGQGAFMFRSQAGNPLPFEAVKAQGRADALHTSAGPMPALQLVLDDTLHDTTTSLREFAARCAEQIATLLNDPGAVFAQPGQAARRLQPADVAVLVRTGREAAAVRRELRRRQVASVYLSDKDSVFNSAEARDLLRWLRAVASPRDVRLARAALATRTVGLSVAELLHLAADDEAFDVRAEQLRQLQAIWQNQGVLAMLRQTLHVLGLPARWLAGAGGDAGQAATSGPADGERRLTNVLHLAELLQTASAQLDGEQALIRWLAAQTAGEGAAGDEQVLRLESDADLVKLITIHKSKGLEYAVVFLPFASSFRGRDKGNTAQVSRVDAAGQRHLQLQPSADDITADDLERQREDMRLLYVALTRARYALWVGLAALKTGHSADCTWHRSAVGQLLTGQPADGKPVAPQSLMALVQAAVQGCSSIQLQPALPMDQVACTPWQPRGQAQPLRVLSPYAANFDRRWTLGSFSGLVRDLAATAGNRSSSLLSALAEHDDDPVQGTAAEWPVPTPPGTAQAAQGQPWHSFARGALPGNFVHDQLEWLAREGFALASRPDLQQQLQRRCERQGWQARAQELQLWLAEAVATPLPPLLPGNATLQDVRNPMPEMEFWLPSAGLVAAKVDALCKQHILPGLARPALPERELHGMLMGFADLVFEHGGRYWVLDYKTNHLGAQDADYTPAALHAAVAEHRYDVQAAIYLLALHRLLRARLGAAYQSSQHLGGAVVFFLRGIKAPARGCVAVPAAPALLQGMDSLLGAAEAAAGGAAP